MEFLNRLYLLICCSVQDFFHDEEGAVDIVAIVVLIGIAVLLAALFRQQIESLLRTLLSNIGDKAKDAAGVN